MAMKSRKEFIQKAKDIEKEFGFPVTLITEKAGTGLTFPLIQASDQYVVYIIAPEEKTEKLIRKIQERAFSLGVSVQTVPPVKDLIRMAHEKPEVWSFWLKPMGILVPFLFHKEVYGTYARELRKEFNQTFRSQILSAVKRRREHMNAVQKKWQEMMKTRIDENLLRMAETVMENNCTLLMAFDRSGRPFGLALRKTIKEAFGKTLPLVFIDPTLIRYLEHPRERDFKKFEQQYAKLIPHLKGARIAFVDDGIGEGRTTGRMHDLIERYHPAAITEVIAGHKMTSGRKDYDAYIGVREKKGSFVTRVGRTSKGQRWERDELRKQINQSARTTAKALFQRRKI